MRSAYASSTVSLQEVLVAGDFVRHALFGVGLLAEIRGWCASEPVGLVAAPALGESRYMAFGLQIDAEKRITIGILRDIAAGTAGSGLAGTCCRRICEFVFHDAIFSEFLRGREPQ